MKLKYVTANTFQLSSSDKRAQVWSPTGSFLRQTPTTPVPCGVLTISPSPRRRRRSPPCRFTSSSSCSSWGCLMSLELSLAKPAREIETVWKATQTCAALANLAPSDVHASTLGDLWLVGAGGPREKVVTRGREEERTWSPFLLQESSWACSSFSSHCSAVFR